LPLTLINTLFAAAAALVGINPSVANATPPAPAPIVAQAATQPSATALPVVVTPTATVRTAIDLPLVGQRVEAPFGPVLAIEAQPTPEPTATPAPAVPAAAQRAPRNDQEAFIFKIAGGGQQSQRTTGVPASVTIAQAILESNWGRSYLAREANNLFGIKALTREGPAGVVWIDAWEVENGQNVYVPQPFRKYNSMAESIVDHGRFFIENRRYAPALAAKDDPNEFARRIAAAGYATDPSYAPKLIALMDRYDLYQWDL
jgi:flagellum-specific peptidoglycan hydrolase FlgJ